MSEQKDKTEKAWAFMTASLRLLTESYRMIQTGGSQAEIKSLELSISELLKARSMVARRIHG